ncbi:MAG TPA: hypothetical protein VFU06_15175 [Longimicrobiales bacterium]|nr:hypothetical protein [Longimicrobiales bacterium]
MRHPSYRAPSRLRRALRARPAALTFAALALSSCGDGNGGITDPEQPEPPIEREPNAVVGDNVPVTTTIDTSGGVVVATGKDGTRYTLTVPKHALPGPVEITVTPLAALEGVPLSGTIAAASLEPHGLVFQRPAELTIVAPGAVTADAVGLSHQDEDVHLVPARVSGDTARVWLAHFSSGGAGNGTPAEVAAMAAGPASSPAETAQEAIAAEVARAAAAYEIPDQALIETILRTWYEAEIGPGLESADAETLAAALGSYGLWLSYVQTWADRQLDDVVSAAAAAAAATLRSEIDRLNDACAESGNAGGLSEIVRLVGLAEAYALSELEPALGLEAVTDRLCLQVVILEAELPDTLEGTAQLDVRAGVSIGGREPTFSTPLDITFSSAQLSTTPPGGQTDADGRFSAEAHLREGSSEGDVLIEVTYPPLVLVRASHRLFFEGVPRLSLSADGEDEVTVGTDEVLQLEVQVNKGRGAYVGADVALVLEGEGSLSSSTARVDGEGTASVRYTAPAEPDTVLVIARMVEGEETLADTVTVFVEETGVEVIVQFATWIITANAWDGENEEWQASDDVSQENELHGDTSVVAAAGSSRASATLVHTSRFEPGTDEFLYRASTSANLSGSVTASGGDAEAEVQAVSEIFLGFEVHSPVYYVLEGTAANDNGTGTVILILGEPRQEFVNESWYDGERELASAGWLEPGVYSFVIASGVPLDTADPDGAATGSASHDVTFTLLAEEPS